MVPQSAEVFTTVSRFHAERGLRRIGAIALVLFGLLGLVGWYPSLAFGAASDGNQVDCGWDTTREAQEDSRALPGRVRVILEEYLWHREFRPEPDSTVATGLERLRPSPGLAEVLRCFRVLRVWRSMAQLERPLGDRLRVVDYSTWVREAGRGTRRARRAYEIPKLESQQGAFQMAFPANVDLTALVSELAAEPGVRVAETLRIPLPDGNLVETPDPGWLAPAHANFDARLARGRWGLHNAGATLGPEYLEDFDIDAPEAWRLQRGRPELVVAVLDVGVDVTHFDLYLNVFLNNGELPEPIVQSYRAASAGDGLPQALTVFDLNESQVRQGLARPGCAADGGACIDTNGNGYLDAEDAVTWWSDGRDDDANGFRDDIAGWNFRDGDNLPFKRGQSGHGTRVAGLIAALADNGKGIAGVAPRVRILPIASIFEGAEIAYALDFPAVRIINHAMSWSYGGAPQEEINDLLSTLEPEGVLLVSALGNVNGFYYGSDPAQREPVVVVGNFTGAGRRSRASGYGPKTDVAAPGTGLYSLSQRGATGSGDVDWFGGTSAASAVTAGVAALTLSERPGLSPEQIRQVLRMSAMDPHTVPGDRGENLPGWDLYSGWGLVNAAAAVQAVRSGALYAEANLLSLPMNFSNPRRNEELAIALGKLPLRAYLGLPAGGLVDWTLRRSAHWDLREASVVARGTQSPFVDGRAFFTLDTDPWDAGRHVLDLEVRSPAGVVSRDRAVVDLPRAYLANIKRGEHIGRSPMLKGFAYGPEFRYFAIAIAPGWSPDDEQFSEVFRSPRERAPRLPAEPGTWISTQTLVSGLDLASWPHTGKATLRLTTVGASQWRFDERVWIGP